MFKYGDIIFINHTQSKLSKVIAWFMNSPFSHSAIVCQPLFFGKTLLTETSDFEVTMNYLDRYIDDPRVSVEVYRDECISDKDRIKISYASTFQLGNLYGWLQLLSFAVREIVRKLTKKKINNFFRQGQVCCSVIGYSYKNGIRDHWLGKIDPESYHTEELRQMLIKNGFKLIYKKEV